MKDITPEGIKKLIAEGIWNGNTIHINEIINNKIKELQRDYEGKALINKLTELFEK